MFKILHIPRNFFAIINVCISNSTIIIIHKEGVCKCPIVCCGNRSTPGKNTEGEEKREVSLNKDERESLQVPPWRIHQPPVLHFGFWEVL